MAVSGAQVKKTIETEAKTALSSAEKSLGRGASNVQKKAWAYAFASLKFGGQLAAQNKTVNSVLETGSAGTALGLQTASIIQKMRKGKYATDPSGIKALGDINGLTQGIVAFAGSFGGNQEVLRAVGDLSGAAIGCGMAAMSAGPISAGVACAFSVGTVLGSLFSSKPPEPKLPTQVPRAVFSPDDEHNLFFHQASTDAYRLAKILKNVYGAESQAALTAHIDKLYTTEERSIEASAGTYLTSATFPSMRSTGPSDNTPAFDVRQLLYMLSFDVSSVNLQESCSVGDDATCARWQNISRCLKYLIYKAIYNAQPGTEYKVGLQKALRLLDDRTWFTRLHWDADIPLMFIHLGAIEATKLERGRGVVQFNFEDDPSGRGHLLHTQAEYNRLYGSFDENRGRFPSGNTLEPSGAGFGYAHGAREYLDLTPFTRLYELIRVFGGFTYAETVNEQSPEGPLSSAGGFPVSWFVNGGDSRSGQIDRAQYDERQFYTNWPRAFNNNAGSGSDRYSVNSMVIALRSRNERAEMEYGLIRLISAASFMHAQYRWQEPMAQLYEKYEGDKLGHDLLDSVDKMHPGDDFAQLKNPLPIGPMETSAQYGARLIADMQHVDATVRAARAEATGIYELPAGGGQLLLADPNKLLTSSLSTYKNLSSTADGRAFIEASVKAHQDKKQRELLTWLAIGGGAAALWYWKKK